ncbi:MAG TPA: rod shape-determining protein [Bryobacteraceae bacterium]|jgi:rod shape-determining protein MreB|nr:rod shape-determining protein [Bryobacteraceae bacterium]
MTYRSLLRKFSPDLAIDLGTANTLVYVAGKGIVLNEPSMLAVDRRSGDVVGCGTAARDMLGRTPGNIVAIRPLREGVIADFKMAERMLNYFIQKAHRRRTLMRPRVVIGVPSETTEVEKRAVLDSTYRAKASEVHLVEQPVVAALGAGLPVTEPSGNMVVDIGGGTTDIAIISLSGVVYSRSLRVAGNHMDDAIMEYIKKKYNLLIGERSAERIKIDVGSAHPLSKTISTEVKGRDLIHGLPKTITVKDDEIRESLSDAVGAIVAAVRVALEHTPPELTGDISERGIILTGGGSLLRNFDERLKVETGIPILMADEPLASAVLGTGKMLSDTKLLKKMALN